MTYTPRDACEFPNDNPDLHTGAAWVCLEPLAPARAVLRSSLLPRIRAELLTPARPSQASRLAHDATASASGSDDVVSRLIALVERLDTSVPAQAAIELDPIVESRRMLTALALCKPLRIVENVPAPPAHVYGAIGATRPAPPPPVEEQRSTATEAEHDSDAEPMTLRGFELAQALVHAQARAPSAPVEAEATVPDVEVASPVVGAESDAVESDDEWPDLNLLHSGLELPRSMIQVRPKRVSPEPIYVVQAPSDSAAQGNDDVSAATTDPIEAVREETLPSPSVEAPSLETIEEGTAEMVEEAIVESGSIAIEQTSAESAEHGSLSAREQLDLEFEWAKHESASEVQAAPISVRGHDQLDLEFEWVKNEASEEQPLAAGATTQCQSTTEAAVSERAPEIRESFIRMIAPSSELDVADASEEPSIPAAALDLIEAAELVGTANEHVVSSSTTTVSEGAELGGFAGFVDALAQVALARGATRAAAILPSFFNSTEIEASLLNDVLSVELQEAKLGTLHEGRFRIAEAFSAAALAWRNLLDGSSEDFSACESTLDDWGTTVLLGMGTPGTHAEIKRELRRKGVAAFGMRAAA